MATPLLRPCFVGASPNQALLRVSIDRSIDRSIRVYQPFSSVARSRSVWVDAAVDAAGGAFRIVSSNRMHALTHPFAPHTHSSPSLFAPSSSGSPAQMAGGKDETYDYLFKGA